VVVSFGDFQGAGSSTLPDGWVVSKFVVTMQCARSGGMRRKKEIKPVGDICDMNNEHLSTKEDRERIIDDLVQHSLNRDFHYLECACSSARHTLRIEIDSNLDDRDWPPEFCLSVQMVQGRGFWQRLREAILYVLNRESHGYGHWDSFVLSKSDTTRMIDLLRIYARRLDQWKLTGEKEE